MARVNSIINISGKVDDNVHVNSKYGQLLRKAPKNAKNTSALERQYNRTGLLNSLAGELNRIIGAYSGTLKPSDFYQALQKRFRKEPLNNRFLLLKQLEGMEVNTTYTLNKLGDTRVTVKDTSKKIMVQLHILFHPSKYVGTYEANCYAYEVSLLCWNQSPRPPIHARQFGEWIYLTDGLPEFEFQFSRPAGTVHWLVCVKQQVGVNEEPIPSFCGEGMQIISVGTFDKKDLALLTKRKEEEMAQAAKAAAKKDQEQIIRVKAKTKKKL
jgi:hypothetical protein